MHQLGLDIHGALQWISQYLDHLVAKFLKAWNNIPVYGWSFEVLMIAVLSFRLN
ncbi:hypothetical protein CPB85DRAFT_1300815 [Mucidula mucida]|nr:hypothetical protein CPB85DRAFT_1300815 [Mucidula mucida]